MGSIHLVTLLATPPTRFFECQIQLDMTRLSQIYAIESRQHRVASCEYFVKCFEAGWRQYTYAFGGSFKSGNYASKMLTLNFVM